MVRYISSNFQCKKYLYQVDSNTRRKIIELKYNYIKKLIMKMVILKNVKEMYKLDENASQLLIYLHVYKSINTF